LFLKVLALAISILFLADFIFAKISPPDACKKSMLLSYHERDKKASGIKIPLIGEHK
jgi:hypothetical protein